MTGEPPPTATPFDAATRDVVFGEVWSPPGLTRRDRRWVTLTCVAARGGRRGLDVIGERVG